MEKRRENGTLKELAAMIDLEAARRAKLKFGGAVIKMAMFMDKEKLTQDAARSLIPFAAQRREGDMSAETPREYIDNERKVLMGEMLTFAHTQGGQQ